MAPVQARVEELSPAAANDVRYVRGANILSSEAAVWFLARGLGGSHGAGAKVAAKAPSESREPREIVAPATRQTDERLAKRMFAGDDRAAEELLSRYRRPLFGMLFRLCRDPAEAEDLFQETFMKALRFSHSYDSRRHFKPWLFTIAMNLARDRARRLAHPATPQLEDPSEIARRTDTDDGPSETALANHADLLAALSRLPEAQREVILLRYFQGLEEPEIAASMKIPRGTVKSRLFRAIRRLRQALGATP